MATAPSQKPKPHSSRVMDAVLLMLCLSFFIVPFYSTFLVALAPICALIVLPKTSAGNHLLNTFARPAMTLGGAVVGYCMIASVLSTDPMTNFLEVLILLAGLLCFLVLLHGIERINAKKAKRVFVATSWGFALSAFGIALLRLSGFYPSDLFATDYANSVCLLLLVGWSQATFWWPRHKRVGFVLIVITLSLMMGLLPFLQIFGYVDYNSALGRIGHATGWIGGVLLGLTLLRGILKLKNLADATRRKSAKSFSLVFGISIALMGMNSYDLSKAVWPIWIVIFMAGILLMILALKANVETHD
jgi:hypothetical protein